MTKKTKRILIIGAVALLALILASIYTVFIKPKMEKSYYIYEETSVNAGTLSSHVSESGSLEYKIKSISYDIDVNVANDDDDDDEDEDELTQRYLTIEEIYAISGMRVSKGDPLLKFSEDSIESVRKLLQSALADAKQEYNDAEKEYNLSALEAKTSLEKREVAKKYAAKIYKGKIKDVSNNISSMQVQLESDQAKVESLQEKIDSAYEKYVEANDTYTASKEYYEALVEGNSSLVISYMNTYLNAKNSYEKALETYENAVEALDKNNAEIASLKTNIYNSKASKLIETLALKADYDEAFLYGDYAELAYQAAIEDLKETLNEAKEDKETYEEKLEAFEALVGTDGILYAEEDGIITESNYSAGRFRPL